MGPEVRGETKVKSKTLLLFGVVLMLMFISLSARGSVVSADDGSSYYYSGADHDTQDLGGIRWLIFAASSLAVGCGLMSFAKRGEASAKLARVGTRVSLLLGVPLTIIGFVEIPWSSFIRSCASESSGICAHKVYLHDPAMGAIGILLLIAAAIIAGVAAQRRASDGETRALSR
jgi:hypothetical protein